MTENLTSAATPEYLLGHDPRELARLERQGALLASASLTILRAAGLGEGQRVLDLGCGAGDLTMLAATLVGPTGSVHGVDAAAEALGWAEARAAAAGLANISVEQAEVGELVSEGGYDAVIGRLLHLYLPDPAAALARSATLLRPGGVLVALEYDVPGLGVSLDLPIVSDVRRWIVSAMRAAGVDPAIGPRLAEYFAAAGLPEVSTLAAVQYSAPGDGGWHGAETTRSMLPLILARGIATAEEVGIDTLQQRLDEATLAAGCWFRHPPLVGTWARV